MFNRPVKHATLNLLRLVFLVGLIWQLSVPTHAQRQPQAELNTKNALVQGTGVSGTTTPSDLASKRVLILHSFAYAQPAYKIIDAALIESFVSSGLNFNNLYFEFLDLARNPGQEYRKGLIESLRNKYRGSKFDLVITLHPDALLFLLKEGRDVYPQGPIISILDQQDIEHSDLKRPLISLRVWTDATLTAKNIFSLKPDTQKILLVSGSSAHDRQLRDFVQAQLKAWKEGLDVEYIPPLPLDEILKKVAHLPAKTAILYTTVFADSTGKTYIPMDVARMISKAANAPVFGFYETLLGDNGVVGGTMMNHRFEGERAVRSAMEVLRGNVPTKPITILPGTLFPTFDWQQMDRWGMNASALPSDAIILNKPVSPWERYKYYIVGVLVFSLLETALILILIAQRRRKKAAEESQRKAEEKYRGIFEGAVEGIFETSPQGQVLTANPALANMLAYASPDEFTSSIRDVTNQVWVNPDERAEYVQLMEKQDVVIGFESQLLRRDGTKIWVSLSGRRVCGPDGKTLYYSGFIEDITERKRAEAHTFEARKELLRLERLSRMGELSASLSHELNQPLTSILSNAKAALRFIQSDRLDIGELKEILQDIANDDKRAGDIVRSLRSMVKPEEGEREAVSINDVLRETVSLFRSEAIIRNIRVEMEFADPLPLVHVNKVQIQQVVINLMMNGAESMGLDKYKDGEIILQTKVPRDGVVQVAVRDFGPGVKEEELKKIFEPFFTTKRSGLGMGLSLSHSIIEAHGGHIWVENNPDRGATFYFDLPVISKE